LIFVSAARAEHQSPARVQVLSLAGAYWKGDAENPQMQRIYGTAFFTQKNSMPG